MRLDEAITDVVVRAVERALAPYLRRLSDPEPLVYNVEETAQVLRTSTKTVRRLLAEGVLPTVPHMGERLLIPRTAVNRLVEAGAASTSEADVVNLRGRLAADETTPDTNQSAG